MKAKYLFCILFLMLVSCHPSIDKNFVYSPPEIVEILLKKNELFLIEEVNHMLANSSNTFQIIDVYREPVALESNDEFVRVGLSQLINQKFVSEIKTSENITFLMGPGAPQAFLLLTSLGIEKVFLINEEVDLDPAEYNYVQVYNDAIQEYQKDMSPVPPKPRKIILTKKPAQEEEEGEGC